MPVGYSVDNIIPINFILTAAGLGYGDFSSAFIFADISDMPVSRVLLTEGGEDILTEGEESILSEDEAVSSLASTVTFPVDTYRDYSSLSELGNDFAVGSDVYKIATRYFSQVPRPSTVTVWMKNPQDTSLLDSVNKAESTAWRYHYFFKNSDLGNTNVIALSDWSDTVNHPIWFTTTEAEVLDQNESTDILSRLAAKGNRHMFAGWRSVDAVVDDSTQAYSMVQVAAAFAKFRPTGKDTAITAEYQVLPGVDGDELKTHQYNALKAKKGVFFTPVELAGEKDSCRVINSVSMSSYGEFIDDVINLDVLKNHMQVDGYNYIANVGTKRPLTSKGYGGLLNVLAGTLKRFYDNGVLGEGTYTDPDTGTEKIAEFGFVIRSKAEDVLNLTLAERKKRKYPPTSVLVILARAGHVAELNITVE